MNYMEQDGHRRLRIKEFIRVPRYRDGKELKEKPDLVKGQKVRLKKKPEKTRKVLHAEYHYQKKGWSYIIEVGGEHYQGFEPKFLIEELEIIN